MEITELKWANAAHTRVFATIDGTETTVSIDAFASIPAAIRALIAAGENVAAYQPAADDVRAEASRRMQALVSARDAKHLEQIITNGNREAIRLQNLKLDFLAGAGPDWTAEQTARAVQLKAFDAAIEAIRAASNAMEPNPPADYAADLHWPPQ